ncbi:IS4 family transposase, partial [Endothiovibrio diazotrophicus]
FGDIARTTLNSVSKQAVSQACRKLPHSALIALHQQIVDTFYDHAQTPRWMGFRLIAADGSKIRLPRLKVFADAFGTQTNGTDTERPMALLMSFYDALTQVTVASELAPSTMGERFLAERLLQHFGPQDLVLYDRGFPSFPLFALHLARGIPVCMRMPKGFNARVKAFIASNRRERNIVLTPNTEARKVCAFLDVPTDPITLRLVRVRLKSGEIEVLATSLMDRTQYPWHLFKDLYHQRWAVEEGFKSLKHVADLERFRGKNEAVVFQEIYARLITHTIASIVRFAAGDVVDGRVDARRLRYRINFAEAYRKVQSRLIEMLTLPDPLPTIRLTLQLVAKNLEPVRPDRSYPRERAPSVRASARTYGKSMGCA